MTDTDRPKVLEGAAFEYIERGVSIIPIDPSSKKPLIKWKEFQDRIATEADIAGWQALAEKHKIKPEDMKLAAVTGGISGFVIVDCDNPEAVEYCKQAGVWSPVRARTKHGIHLYFNHAMDMEYRPRAGSNSKGIDWPKLPGLDFRGDGSYALVPPSANYVWEVEEGFSADDKTDWPIWTGWPMSKKEAPDQTTLFSDLDLSAVVVKPLISVWDATREYVAERFPQTFLIPSNQSNGRNQRVLSFAAEQLLYGFWGDTLNDRVLAFMDNFFEERLPEEEWKATCRSVEAMERANHPERFASDGTYMAPMVPPQSEEQKREEQKAEDEKDDGTVEASKIAERLKDLKDDYYVRPMIPANSIIQVVGYSGQGKSTFVQMLVHALAIKRKTFGPFEIDRSPRKILYLNYEEGQRTIKERMEDNVRLLGDFDPNDPDRLIIYAPSLSIDEGMALNTEAGLKRLGSLLRKHEPDMLVIDTTRSAFPGLDENDAASWTKINDICLRLRNIGVSVVILHHRNKATVDGMGSYAGSTNQITVIETQVFITQLYSDEETAKARGGKVDEEGKIYQQFYDRLAGGRVDWVLDWVMEIEYGKTRDWTDDHDKLQWIALATNILTDRQTMVALPSSKQKAIRMYHDNFTIQQICQSVYRRKSTVLRWLEPYQIGGGQP